MNFPKSKQQLAKFFDLDQIVGLDFETYYDKDYTLKKMSTTEYVRHRLFKVQSVALQNHSQRRAETYGNATDIHTALNNIDWSRTGLLCHHTHFDGLILSHHFGIVPRTYFCTLSMARPLHGNEIRADLDSVAQYYGVGNKLEGVLEGIKGKLDLTDEEQLELLKYNAVDVEVMWKIFEQMLDKFPVEEYKLIHHTVSAYANPVLKVNKALASREHKSEIQRREDLLERVGATKEDLRSRETFAQMLRDLDVEPPTKISPRTGELTYAFAKNDLDFQALFRHDNEQVRDLVSARQLCSSSIAETRARRLIEHGRKGPLPIYLKYGGAHTLRWSGGDKMNPQNFPRNSSLRQAIKAPPGHKLIVFDSGQIEARVNAWLAGQDDLVEQFRAKDNGDNSKDPYKLMAVDLFNVDYDDVEDIQRFVGKTCILGLGYQMGAPKLHFTLISGSQGPPVKCELEECYAWVNTYRKKNRAIVKQWDYMHNQALPVMYGVKAPREYGPVEFDKGGYLSANGMFMRYPNMKAKSLENKFTGECSYDNFSYNNGKHLYGGLITENCVQNLARHIVAYQILQVSDDYRLVLQVHDEGVWCVPKNQADEAYERVEKAFRTPPSWAPDIPVIGEGVISPTYVKP